MDVLDRWYVLSDLLLMSQNLGFNSNLSVHENVIVALLLCCRAAAKIVAVSMAE